MSSTLSLTWQRACRMTSVRNQVLNQVCLTPKKTVKQLSYALNIPENQVRLVLYKLEANGKVFKTNAQRPFRYAFGGTKEVRPETACWCPDRTMGEFLRSLRNGND